MEYKGWIPTVTGRLSFDFFGDSDCPSEAISQNVSDSESRYVIIYQKRSLSDATLPFKHRATQFFFRHQSVFWFVCLGFSSEHQPPSPLPLSPSPPEPPLAGRLYIFSTNSHWTNTVEREIASVQDLLERCSKPRILIEKKLHAHFDVEYKKLLEFLCEHAIFCADYNLSRTGVLNLNADASLTKNINAPKFPSEPNAHKHLQHIVCSQLFFFLRDIGHRHQHHYPTTDTIIDLYPSTADDTTWRRETLRSLCRKAVEFKRSKRYELYSAALGVLAYIKSFQHINNIETNGQKVLPGFNVISLEKGINAAIHSYNYYSNQKHAKNDKIRNLTIASFGFFLSFVGLYKLTNINDVYVTPETKEFVRYHIGYILNHPLTTLSFAIVIFLLLSLSTNIIDIFNLKITRGLQRLVITFGIKSAILISSTCSLVFLLLTLRYLFS